MAGLPPFGRGWGGLLYHYEKEHLDRNNPFRCHCPHRPSGHGRHAELRNVIEKSELKKEQRFKNKKTEPDVSRALVFLLYILSCPQIFVRVPVSVHRPPVHPSTKKLKIAIEIKKDEACHLWRASILQNFLPVLGIKTDFS